MRAVAAAAAVVVAAAAAVAVVVVGGGLGKVGDGEVGVAGTWRTAGRAAAPTAP